MRSRKHLFSVSWQLGGMRECAVMHSAAGCCLDAACCRWEGLLLLDTCAAAGVAPRSSGCYCCQGAVVHSRYSLRDVSIPIRPACSLARCPTACAMCCCPTARRPLALRRTWRFMPAVVSAGHELQTLGCSLHN